VRSPRHSTVVAYLALVLAVSGTAIAVNKIGSKQIKKDAVRSKHIKNKGIKFGDISDPARAALKGDKGDAGAQGPAGPEGPPGPPSVPARTVLVGAGGTPAENGTALRDAIAGLPAATEDDPRAILLGAGRYDLAGTGVTVPPDVTISGAGRSATIIESSPAAPALSVVSLADRAGLSDLTVRTASAGVGSTGVDGTDGRDSALDGVRVTAGVGVIMRGGELRDSLVEATSTGVRVLSGSASTTFEMHGSRVRVFSAAGGRAVHASATVLVHDSRLGIIAAAGNADGLFLDATSGLSSVRASQIDGLTPGTMRAIVVSGAGGVPTLEVDASEVEATGATGRALTAIGGRIRAGATKLDAADTSFASGGGTVTCIDVYSGTYAAATCP
jgi:hypothetical protein